MHLIRALSLLVVGLLVPTAGCSRTLAMRKPVTAAGAQHVTQAAAGQTVKVAYRATDQPDAETEVREGVLGIADSGAFVLRPPQGAPVRIPFEDTRTVFVKDRHQGTLEGFLAGAIPGALLGMVIGGAFDSMGCSDDGSGSHCPHEAALTFALGGAVITGLIGTLIGSSVGHRTTFVF